MRVGGELESIVPGAGAQIEEIMRCYRQIQDGLQMSGEISTEIFSNASRNESFD